MEAKQSLIDLFRGLYGKDPEAIIKVESGGSVRDFFRILGENVSVIGTVGKSVKENETFIHMTEVFRSNGLNTPEILIVNEDKTAYLQTDLGKVSLYDLILKEGFESVTVRGVLSRVIKDLALFHEVGRRVRLNFYPVSVMDEKAIRWDLNYFKYCFLKAINYDIDEVKLEEEFGILSRICRANLGDGFMYRDFQSRNIVLDNQLNTGYVDFQGGRRGKGLYDLVSFLWQSRLNFPTELRDSLVEEYIAQSGENAATLRSELPYFILLRGLQTLGAYGLRGITERKEMFRSSIPKTLQNLTSLPDEVFAKLPYIGKILQDCQKQFHVTANVEKQLTITIGSFSYKKGIPDDKTGNGGGFVFDCRGIDNPGRYDEYKSLTGRDRAVVEFMERAEGTDNFVNNVKGLLEISIKEYLRRGFTSLSVWFGCTGGQHRSVYFAEHMAKYIHENYPVKVVLIHREQGITKEMDRI